MTEPTPGLEGRTEADLQDAVEAADYVAADLVTPGDALAGEGDVPDDGREMRSRRVADAEAADTRSADGDPGRDWVLAGGCTTDRRNDGVEKPYVTGRENGGYEGSMPREEATRTTEQDTRTGSDHR